MANVTRTTGTYTAHTNAAAADIEADISALYTAHNNHDAGTSKWTVVSALNASATPLIADNSTGTNNIAEFKDNGTAVVTIADGGATTFTGNVTVQGTLTPTTLSHPLFYYRRPNLTFISVTTVDVENNTSTANQTTILFPDGSTRSVTEDTSAANKYRRFDITATANFTSGTEDSGLRSGISEVANTRYAVYAVKSQIDSTKFVLAGDTTFPTRADVSTLDTRYGSNSWVFLGYIINGNGQGGSSDIMSFKQCGPLMQFNNTNSAAVLACPGILMTTTAGATTLTYTYAAGSANAQVPDTITSVNWGVTWAGVAGAVIGKDAGGARTYYQVHANSASNSANWWATASEGVQLSNGPGSSVAQDIYIRGYFDSALAHGLAPLF